MHAIRQLASFRGAQAYTVRRPGAASGFGTPVFAAGTDERHRSRPIECGAEVAAGLHLSHSAEREEGIYLALAKNQFGYVLTHRGAHLVTVPGAAACEPHVFSLRMTSRV